MHKDILEDNSLGSRDLLFSLHSQFSLLSLLLFHTLAGGEGGEGKKKKSSKSW